MSNKLFGDIPEMLGKQLGEGVKKDVNVPISKAGEQSITMNPSLYAKGRRLESEEDEFERPSSNRSNDSFKIAIKKFE